MTFEASTVDSLSPAKILDVGNLGELGAVRTMLIRSDEVPRSVDDRSYDYVPVNCRTVFRQLLTETYELLAEVAQGRIG